MRKLNPINAFLILTAVSSRPCYFHREKTLEGYAFWSGVWHAAHRVHLEPLISKTSTGTSQPPEV